MKKLMCLMVALAFVGCSSKAKKDEAAAAAAAPVIEQKATTPMTAAETKKAEKEAKKAAKQAEKEAKAEAKKAADEAKAASAPAPTEATPAAASTSSDNAFGAITGTEKSSTSCANKGDSRKITVLGTADGGCGVVYNKAGEDKTVAVAKSESYCSNVATKIKTNLEGAGFDCGGGSAAAPAATSSSDAQ